MRPLISCLETASIQVQNQPDRHRKDGDCCQPIPGPLQRVRLNWVDGNHEVVAEPGMAKKRSTPGIPPAQTAVESHRSQHQDKPGHCEVTVCSPLSATLLAIGVVATFRYRYSHWAPAQRKLNPVWIAVRKLFLAEVSRSTTRRSKAAQCPTPVQGAGMGPYQLSKYRKMVLAHRA